MIGIRSRIAGGAVAVGLALGGCSPEYNWREIRPDDGGYAVLLPAKPSASSRDVQLDDLKTPMAMQQAKVGETVFAVAVARLPDASDHTQRKALAAMRAGMVRNIGGRETAARPVAVDVVDTGGRRNGQLNATEVEVAGSLKGAATTMVVRFAARDAYAYQWLVLGQAIDRDQAAVFLESFKALR
ncbi:MAG TPA: hypothetical protein VM491_08615 [Burkholderiaceae bacterium]|nr:hypothetical protein [Burkholderiaceae bacterium]